MGPLELLGAGMKRAALVGSEWFGQATKRSHRHDSNV
jgi:hypothetical protein